MTRGVVYIGDSRTMPEINDETIDLIITSPPYWHIKDYGVDGQIGYNQTLHEYLKDLFKVWSECYRVLKPGARLCINVGDQFLRKIIYGRYKIAPLHSEVINQCEFLGFDYMGAIIWQKKTTMNTTGGANVMGSFPYPPNGMIEIDYEFILIFKKPGNKKVKKEAKLASKLTKEEWKEYFSGHWNFPGERQIEHEAMFPEELPKRLIKMFSVVGDIILDPFLGSGTTVKVALELERNAIGYEINPEFIPIIKRKLAHLSSLVEFVKREDKVATNNAINLNYSPYIQDIQPVIKPSLLKFGNEQLYKVIEIPFACGLKLDTGITIKFCGIEIINEAGAIEYLNKFVKGKLVFLKFDPLIKIHNELFAYVFLKNKIFINKELLKLGLAKVANYDFSLRKKFEKIKNVQRVDSKYGD